ncbi:MAG: hypothetical protein Q8L77_10240 [Nitrospirota bacterium]|nr:hypothetical protein [Nitrospirota bacterium]
MTSMMSGKCNVITTMAMRAAISLCMVAMVVGCSSGRDSSSRPVPPGGGVAGQVQSSNGAVASRDNLSGEKQGFHACTNEEREAAMKEASEMEKTSKKEPMNGYLASTLDTGLGFLGMRKIVGESLVSDTNRAVGDLNRVKSGVPEQKAIAALSDAQCDSSGRLQLPATPEK